MIDLDFGVAREVLHEATHVFVFSGAGMSVPLGTPTYWTGGNSLYGSGYSKWELTALEHATQKFWWSHRQEQLAYFNEFHTGTTKQHNETNHYHELLKFLSRNNKEYFNITSNIDNAFIYSGYRQDRLYEIHGATRYSQCLMHPETHGLFETETHKPTICPTCGADARPNVLFFDDFDYVETLTHEQHKQYKRFVQDAPPETSVILEIGAGVTINTIRNTAIRLHAYNNMPLIRINPNPYPSSGDLILERVIRNGSVGKPKPELYVLETDTLMGLNMLY